MHFNTGGIQALNIHLDLYDSQLLQMHKSLLQNTLLRSTVHPDVDYMPIPIFFGQAPPFAPVLYEIQHCIQYVQITDFRWFPLLWKTRFDFLIFFFLQFHKPIISYPFTYVNTT